MLVHAKMKPQLYNKNVDFARRAGLPAVWCIALLYTLAMTIGTLLPSGDTAGAGGGWDSAIAPAAQNLLHLPAYAIMTLLLLTAAGRTWSLGRWLPLLLVVFCIVYGAAMEWIQAVAVPGRCGSWMDALLNTLGAAAGYSVWLLFRNMLSPIRRVQASF